MTEILNNIIDAISPGKNSRWATVSPPVDSTSKGLFYFTSLTKVHSRVDRLYFSAILIPIYSDMKTVQREIINAALAAAVGVVGIKACDLPQKAMTEAIIAGQKDEILKLTDQNSMCLIDSSVANNDVAEVPEPKDVEPPASVSDYEKLKNEHIFHFSRSCQWGRDSVIVATRFRHSCEESEKLLKDIETKILHCDSALKLVNTPEEKATLEKSKEILEKLAKNHHILPPQCPGKPEVNQ